MVIFRSLRDTWEVEKTFKGLTYWSWLRLLSLPIGLSIYIFGFIKAEPDSTLAYYLFSNLFAIPFSLLVVAFWESFDNARKWAIALIAIQPIILLMFFWN